MMIVNPLIVKRSRQRTQGLLRSVLDFVLVSSKNPGTLEHMVNPRKSDKSPIKSMVMCVWQVTRRDSMKWAKVDL
jgi:hypothetical protein